MNKFDRPMTDCVKVRLTRHQRVFLQAAADAAGVTVSDYVRGAALYRALSVEVIHKISPDRIHIGDAR